MWTRRELKERAKAVLRLVYWKAFGVSLVVLLVTGGLGGGSGYKYDGSEFPLYADELLQWVVPAFPILFLLLVLRVFLGYTLEVGGRRYFVRSAQYTDNRGCFRAAFSSRYYMKIVLTMLLKGVQNFLWFLLLIIPGIIKHYAYSMVPYILSDNPNIGYKRAIQLSRQMTANHKFDLYVLELSFIGWYLLGLLALVIGTLFVFPYCYATQAEMYLLLRKNALDKGMCTYEELSMINPAQQQGIQEGTS